MGYEQNRIPNLIRYCSFYVLMFHKDSMRAVAQPTLRAVISLRPTAELNQSSKMLITVPLSLSLFESSLLKQPQDPSEHSLSGSLPASPSVQLRSPGAQSLSGSISSSSITDGLKHPTCPATQSLSGKS